MTPRPSSSRSCSSASTTTSRLSGSPEKLPNVTTSPAAINNRKTVHSTIPEADRETDRSSTQTPASGMAFVQTPCGGWFVLKDKSQGICSDDYGMESVLDFFQVVDDPGVASSGLEMMRKDLMDSMTEW